MQSGNLRSLSKHHKPVDDHESIYLIDELLEWKRRQVTEDTGRELSENQLAEILQHLERSLAGLTEVKLTVHPVGVIESGSNRLIIPLAGLANTTLSTPEQERYLGVQVADEGLVPGHP